MARTARRNPAARGTPDGARKYRGLLAVGFLALCCFAVATLPASLISGTFQRYGISATSYDGTIWSGVANGAVVRGTTLGELHWHARPLALLRGRAAADVEFALPDGSASAKVAAGPGGQLDLSNVRLDLPLEFFAQAPSGMARGWHGRATGAFDEIEVAAAWPVAARGKVQLSGLVMPQLGQYEIGSFEIVAPDPRAPSPESSDVRARVTDKGGPLSLDAVLTLAPGRSFLLEGTVAPRDGAPAGLARALEFLGPADAAGRRQIGMSGTF